jgi:predicted dehydrogenase
MINAAVIGYGYWGPNLVRNFIDNPDSNLLYVCDLDEARVKNLKIRYPQIKTTTNYKDILHDDSVQLVAIATPVSTHYRIAKDALNAGKHVLLEKPMTVRISEAEKLIDLAAKKNLILFVDHTFIYTGAVRHIRDLIAAGHLGDIYYFDSVRVNLGLFQHDVNVIWDLAPHDFSIMDYFISEKPVSVSAIGSACVLGEVEEIAYITVRFVSGLIAHFNVNWMSPVKIRRLMIGGSKKMVVFDDLIPDEKIKIYDKGLLLDLKKKSKDEVYKKIIQYRIGDMYSPKIESSEALKTEIAHLIDCIKHNKKPTTDGEAGLRVVKLLDAAHRSLCKGSACVKI